MQCSVQDRSDKNDRPKESVLAETTETERPKELENKNKERGK